MKPLHVLSGGLAGAAAVTLIHESVKRLIPQAPRMDLLGMQALRKGLHKAGFASPSGTTLYVAAMAGDLLSNSLYYSMAGIGKEQNIWVRSSLLGLAAGLGAITLPSKMGLNERYSSRTTATQIMTVGLYVTGALVATAVIKALGKKKKQKHQDWESRLLTSAMG